jgi:APA family basic amino acid/polyamine antiporter
MAEPELRRHLGPVSAIMVTVGAVIGSGIFLKPHDIARALPDPTWIFICWIGLGVVCLFGALAFAELGALFPEAGGQYAFLRESWGRLPAFLYGWCMLLVINSGSMAALAAALAENLASITPLSGVEKFAVGAAMILFLAAVNHFGVRFGALLQNVATFTKLGALGVIVLGGFLVARRIAAPAAVSATPPVPGPDFTTGLVQASVAIFWAYEGWYQLPFNAAELRNPRRDLPLGLVLGLAILTVTYTAVNAVYLHLVPLAEMRALEYAVDVPNAAVTRAFGAGAGKWLVVLICISVFGAANPNLLANPRGYYAMAKDGLVPGPLVRIHPRYATPSASIWTVALWACVTLAILQGFRDITEYVVFAALFFYVLTVAGVYVLRRRRPDAPRTFRCWGYPLTPAIFIAVALFVDARMFVDPQARSNALMGLLILGAGVPAYFLMERRRRRVV